LFFVHDLLFSSSFSSLGLRLPSFPLFFLFPLFSSLAPLLPVEKEKEKETQRGRRRREEGFRSSERRMRERGGEAFWSSADHRKTSGPFLFKS